MQQARKRTELAHNGAVSAPATAHAPPSIHQRSAALAKQRAY